MSVASSVDFQKTKGESPSGRKRTPVFQHRLIDKLGLGTQILPTPGKKANPVKVLHVTPETSKTQPW